MAAFTGVKEVLKYNTRQFVVDFKRLRYIGVMTKQGDFFRVQKGDVWAAAKRGRIPYYLNEKIYLVRRTSMVLL